MLSACRGFRTRHQLALEMLAKNGASLPHGWIVSDDEMEHPYGFRRRLASFGERSLLAVPSSTAIRDLAVEPPGSSGRGRPPTRPWQRVEAWSQSLDDAAWQRIDVRYGSKVRWWSRWSNGVWRPDPLGVSKAMRIC